MIPNHLSRLITFRIARSALTIEIEPLDLVDRLSGDIDDRHFRHFPLTCFIVRMTGDVGNSEPWNPMNFFVDSKGL